ncbi:MAG: protein kinase domain-containing protein [Coprococcus sp.]
MVDIDKLCPGCMQHLKDSNTTCPHCGYPEKRLTVKDSLPIFSILAGKYLLGAPLGKGGFGITYIAMHLPDEKIVAIKEFFPANLAVRDTNNETVVPADDTKAVYYRTGMKSFSEEGRILYLLSDIEHVVHVAEQIQANNTTYLVMEYVPGISLKKYMKQQQKLFSEQEMLTLMQPILLALQTMHQKGILHRDISPENLMLSPDNTLTLIDFGAARTFSRSDDDNLTVILKRGYAPEEQYHSNSRQGPWTDLYAVCAVMYQMLTGILPQEASARAEEDHLTPISRIEGLSLSPSTCAVLEKGLQMDPMERYPDIGALMKVLYPAKKEAAREITDNSPKETQEMDASEKNAELSKQSESANAPSSINTHTHTYDQVSAPVPDSTVSEKEPPKKKSRKRRYIAIGLIAALCFDLVFGGPLFYPIRGYRYPWFIRPFSSSIGTPESYAMDDALKLNDRETLLSSIREVNDMWDKVINHPDEYSDKIYTKAYIKQLPKWCTKLSENWDNFDFDLTSSYNTESNVSANQSQQEAADIGILIAHTVISADLSYIDSDEACTAISTLFDTAYSSGAAYASENGYADYTTFAGFIPVHLLYSMPLISEQFEDVESIYAMDDSKTTLHNAIQRFFDGHQDAVAEYSVWIDFSSEDNAKDDFLQQMKLYIDENNISWQSETSDTDISESVSSANITSDTTAESIRITAIQENIEDAVASKDHEKLLDNLNETYDIWKTMLSNPSAYNELLSSYSNLLTSWCDHTAEQISNSDFLLSTFLMTDYDSTSKAALADEMLAISRLMSIIGVSSDTAYIDYEFSCATISGLLATTYETIYNNAQESGENNLNDESAIYAAAKAVKMLYTNAVYYSSFADSSDHYLETLHQSLYRFFKSTPESVTRFITYESSSDESAEDEDFYQQLQLFVNDSDSTV